MTSIVSVNKKMTTVKFVGTVSKMGRQRVIYVPKAFHKELEHLEGKQLKITVEEAVK